MVNSGLRRRSLVRRALVLDSDGVGRRVASGAGYKFLGIVVRTIITIGSTAILARLLSPSDFGYVAMATVVTEFAALFGAFGFTNVLIQRRVITRLQLDTVFWATLAVGAALGSLVFILSFFATWMFSDPQVGPLLRVLCLTFFLNSLTAVPWVVLSRLMRFRIELWGQTATVLLRSMTAIGCALAGLGAWSLVIGAVVGATASVVVEFACVPYMPRLRFHRPLLTATWRTSGSYLGSSILYYLSMNIDLVLIGRRLGAAPLGYYQNARGLTDEIRARIAMPIQHVLFPALSSVHSEPARFQELVLRAGRLLAAIVVPIGFAVSANANELVLVLYGQQWNQMIPVMALFGLSASVRAATAVASPIFSAMNRVGTALRYNIVGTVLTLGGVILALPYGIDAVAATVAGTSLYSLVMLRASFAAIGLGIKSVGQVIGMPVVAAMVMWVATAALRSLTDSWQAHPAILLLSHVLAGGCVYLATLHLLARTYLRDLKHVVSKLVKPVQSIRP